MPYIYGNSTDLPSELAKQYGAMGYTYTNDASKLGSDSLVLGGSGADGGLQDSQLNGATRLAGNDRNGTSAAANAYLGNLQAKATQVYDPTADIKAMAAAQKAAALAGLQSAHDRSLSDLSAANAKIEPAYYTQRNATSTDSQIAAKNFAEYLAQRGNNNATGNSGTMEQSDISNNVALQGNLGNLATGEANAYAENAKQVGDLNAAYNSDIAKTNAGIDASSMQALINAQQQYNASKLAQANTDRQYNYTVGRDTVNDTGKLADGTYTQAGALNNTNLQLAQMGVDTARLNLQALPAQLQAQAQQIAQSLAKGAIDIKTAQAQLDYLPTQQALETAQANASINKSNSAASNGGLTPTQQAKAESQQLTGDVQSFLDQWASGKADGQNGRAGQSDMLNYLKANAGVLTQQGVDVNSLATWVKNNYKWDKVDGQWVDTTAK